MKKPSERKSKIAASKRSFFEKIDDKFNYFVGKSDALCRKPDEMSEIRHFRQNARKLSENVGDRTFSSTGYSANIRHSVCSKKLRFSV